MTRGKSLREAYDWDENYRDALGSTKVLFFSFPYCVDS